MVRISLSPPRIMLGPRQLSVSFKDENLGPIIILLTPGLISFLLSRAQLDLLWLGPDSRKRKDYARGSH